MIVLLKKYRTIKNITLRKLSILTGISTTKLNMIENNKYDPRLSAIAKLAEVFEICPIMLLGGCYNRLCNDKCYYYKDRFNDYNKLPPNGQVEVLAFIRYIKKKYKNYMD